MTCNCTPTVNGGHRWACAMNKKSCGHYKSCVCNIDQQKFYYISRHPSEVSHHDPKVAFYSLDEAKKQAESLVVETAGKSFYIMESVLKVSPQKPPMKWEEID